jgi:site-specific DNA recombinase
MERYMGARVMGVMSEEYLEKVRLDTHRGLRGRFDRKMATGGCAFGYRTEPIVVGEDSHGHPMTEGYRLMVDPETAPRVVRIFEAYAHQGLGLRTLAHHLNAEGGSSPRGKGWAPTAIREILRNPIYRGERIWNRSYWVKDHESAKRRRFERPESEWVRQQDEAWRIVSDELWEAAQATRGRRNERHDRDGRGRIQRTSIGGASSRKRLLSGFLQCGECGGSFHELTQRHWGCSWHRNRGTASCSNAIRVPVARLESAVLKAIRAALDEEVAEHALRVALEELQKRIDATQPTKLEAELQQLDTKIERALDLAIELGDLAAAKDRLGSLRTERVRVARDLAQARTNLPTLEELMPVVRAKLEEIEQTLLADVAQGRMALGALLGDRRLRVYEDGRIEGVAVLEPEMLAAPKRTSEPRVSVVAGGGFEPPTSGL